MGMANDATTSDDDIYAHYDMMDDISDLSNDDHETASLVSTLDEDETEEGEMTPDGSLVDVQDEQHYSEAVSTSPPTYTENELIESYLSGDLETPRQSRIIKDFLGPVVGINPCQHGDVSHQILHTARRILFVSDPDVVDDAVSDVCLRIASLLSSDHEAVADSVSQPARLPPMFADTAASSVLQVRLGEEELLVDRCIGASECGDRGFPEYELLLKGSNKDQAAILPSNHRTMGPRLQPLDLVVYYTQTEKPPAWFKHVHSAVDASSSLHLYITAPDVSQAQISKKDADLVVTYEELFHEDDEELRIAMQPRSNLQKSPIKASSTYDKFLYTKLGVPPSLRQRFHWTLFAVGSWILMLAAAMIIPRYLYLLDSIDPVKQVHIRRKALESMWIKTTNSSGTNVAYNVSHLLPYPEVPWPSSGLVPLDVRFQTSAPNHIIIALPQDAASRRFPIVTSTHVQKRGARLDFNQTQLAQGIYDITIRESDANGVIMVTMDTKNPAINVIAEPNFGMSALYRKTYEKASMEISKAINKDVMVAKKNAKSIRNKLGLELTAGAAATKNVTSELAIYIARDLQVLANTAVSVFAKAASASNESSTNLKKELVVIRKDLIKLSDDVQKSLISTAGAVKALIPTVNELKRPVAVAKGRARRIKERVVGRKGAKKTLKDSSLTKDLSLRWRDLFKQDMMLSKAASLKDIARCTRSEDYKACRKEAKAKAKSNRALSATTAEVMKAGTTVASSMSQVSSGDLPTASEPSLDPRKNTDKKRDNKSKKGKKSEQQNGRRSTNGVKKNVKKNEKGGKTGKKWPLR